MSDNLFFNAIHAPVGAHSSFTLGCKGKSGGPGRELGGPVCRNMYIGLEDENGYYEALPFWEGGTDESLRFDHMAKNKKQEELPLLRPFEQNSIQRDFRLGHDIWKTGDFQMEIFAHVISAADPQNSTIEEQMFSYCPAVLVELTIDNTKCNHARRAFFGYDTDGLDGVFQTTDPTGVVNGRATGFYTDSQDAIAGCGFSGADILRQKFIQNLRFGLGISGMLIFNAPAAKISKFHVAIAFYREGYVSTGLNCTYYYTKFFSGLNQVADYALKHFEDYRAAADAAEKRFITPNLNDAQKFQIAHSFSSYYASTQMLLHEGEPLWIVHEGEYRMMNTFDLVIDQAFFELALNPWTVKSELDLYVKRYSYVDQVHSPEDPDTLFPGGIAFTHDVGCRNAFAAQGRSAYECDNLKGCFSHMTHEQLLNWTLTAACYVHDTKDNPWSDVFDACFESILNRDNPDPKKRDGIMAFDSSRTGFGGEITTYDSLDTSLGQARANAYMALKSFAATLALSHILKDDRKRQMALEEAKRTANTLVKIYHEKGFIPALLDGSCNSYIIPVIEGLVYPWYLGLWDELSQFGELLDVLKEHFIKAMESGRCLYPDGAWKLSESADNSWLSKIYLNQFIARKLLGIHAEYTGEKADNAHRNWLFNDENLFYAWSDQMTSGVAKGSKYYPRGVTSILWTFEKE